MGVSGGHDNGLARVEQVIRPVNMVILPTPSRQVTKASPPDSWVLISSPLAKENKVMLRAWFWASVLLTTWPS